MHEAGLLSAAVSALAERRSEPVREVVLAVAPSVDVEAARVAWDAAASGTVLADAQVSFTTARDTLQCLDCGHEYDGDRLTVCPQCGGNGLVVHEAHELEILSWTS
jgi:Zn finger protein HypA/HybF involved in hydrogenase expression